MRSEVPRGRDRDLAVRELFDAHYGRLAGWTARLVGDADLGHDFATEAFVRMLRERAPIDEPRAWLYTVTANLVRDHWRKRDRERRAYARVVAGSTSQQWETGHLDPRSTAPDTSTETTTRLTVEGVVRGLPDRLRLAVILHYYADLPVATVAARLGKSEGAVKRDLHDARQRIAAQLEDPR